jgi:hypothetical protein
MQKIQAGSKRRVQGANRLRSILLLAGFEDRSAPVEQDCSRSCGFGIIEEREGQVAVGSNTESGSTGQA